MGAVGVFLMAIGIMILVFVGIPFCIRIAIERNKKPKPEFPYFELMGLTRDDAKKMYDCDDVPFGYFSYDKVTKVICEFRFPYEEFYEYEKYYEMLDSFAKENKIKIEEQANSYDFIYKIVDFQPPINECGLVKEDNVYRNDIQRKCDNLLAKKLNEISERNKVKNFNERKSAKGKKSKKWVFF